MDEAEAVAIELRNIKLWSDNDLDEECFETKSTIIDEFVNNAPDGILSLKLKAIWDEQTRRQERSAEEKDMHES